jgi:hypothetical protein
MAMLDPRSIANIDELRFFIGHDIIPYALTNSGFSASLKNITASGDLSGISAFSEKKGNRRKQRRRITRRNFSVRSRISLPM